MKNFVICICLVCMLVVATPAGFARPKDTANMMNGTVLKGKLVRVTSGLINMRTKEGFRKFTRVNVINNKDFIEIGLFKREIIAGKIFFLSKHLVEMQTPDGILKVPRYRVRKIVLGHIHEPEEQLQIQLPEDVISEQRNIYEQ